MQIPKPLKSRVLVFSVPVKRKIMGSLLYTPAPRRNSYNGSQECWIIATGPDCTEQYAIGQKAYVHDGFEFEDVKLESLWDDLQNDKRFAQLKEYVEAVDGSVAVQILPETSLLAVED